MDLTKACQMFGVSRNGYYTWLRNTTDQEKKEQKKETDDALHAKVKEIVQRLGSVPGSRTLSACFHRMFGMCIGRKRCRHLLAEMNLAANKPKKDPYKHQATHDHEYANPVGNRLNRDFFIGPRKVILTDITYLYYGPALEPFYVCVFRDAYTDQTLGRYASTKMTVKDLVQPAYDNMMQKYRDELKAPQVFLHSDQGSQYLSTTFRQLISDDGFVQSVSGRGNSLDNSPMESFFARMKTECLSIVAMSNDFETDRDLVYGYLEHYDTKRYQYRLGGLTPDEFYVYVTTGVYPCESYFGVFAENLRTADQLIEERKQKAEEKKKKQAKERGESAKEQGIPAGKDPLRVVSRDIDLLERHIKKWNEFKKTCEMQLKHLNDLLQKAEAAREFIKKASEELRKALRSREEWQKHPELSYIYGMDGLF